MIIIVFVERFIKDGREWGTKDLLSYITGTELFHKILIKYISWLTTICMCYCNGELNRVSNLSNCINS